MLNVYKNVMHYLNRYTNVVYIDRINIYYKIDCFLFINVPISRIFLFYLLGKSSSLAKDYDPLYSASPLASLDGFS